MVCPAVFASLDERQGETESLGTLRKRERDEETAVNSRPRGMEAPVAQGWLKQAVSECTGTAVIGRDALRCHDCADVTTNKSVRAIRMALG